MTCNLWSVTLNPTLLLCIVPLLCCSSTCSVICICLMCHFSKLCLTCVFCWHRPMSSICYLEHTMVNWSSTMFRQRKSTCRQHVTCQWWQTVSLHKWVSIVYWLSYCRIVSSDKAGGLSRLHSADEDAVSWLTNYGSWHAHKKKKIGRHQIRDSQFQTSSVKALKEDGSYFKK